MTKWKQKRLERDKQRHDFAVAAQSVLLKLYCDKTYNVSLSKEEAVKARTALCESSWNVADFMLEAKTS